MKLRIRVLLRMLREHSKNLYNIYTASKNNTVAEAILVEQQYIEFIINSLRALDVK
jgi:hypothetical protein